MKTLRHILLRLSFVLSLSLRAQEPAPAPALAPDDTVDASQLSAEQLDQLVGPIALYPDALIALILPASTAPADVVLAARYLKDGGDPAAVASRSWDESAKSLAHYPALIKWMDDNLSWTKQLGEAFRDQPAEVMKAIQRMRAVARDAGTLASTPQQQVASDGDVITIVPAQPDVIYVPYYDPAIVYVRQNDYYHQPFLTFSAGFAVGSWLSFDCDWRQRTVWTVDRHWSHPDHRDWRHPVFPGQAGFVNDPSRHPWKPSNNFPRQSYANVNVNRSREDGFRPSANANIPPSRADYSDRRNDGRRHDADVNHPNVAVNTFVTPTTPAPAVTPQPARRFDVTRERNDDRGAQPAHAYTQQQNNPPPPQPTTPQNRYPYGPPPSTPLVAPITGPVVAPFPHMSMPPAPASTPPAPAVHFPTAPAPAPAPAATPPPAQNQSQDDRRRDGDRRQPN